MDEALWGKAYMFLDLGKARHEREVIRILEQDYYLGYRILCECLGEAQAERLIGSTRDQGFSAEEAAPLVLLTYLKTLTALTPDLATVLIAQRAGDYRERVAEKTACGALDRSFGELLIRDLPDIRPPEAEALDTGAQKASAPRLG